MKKEKYTGEISKRLYTLITDIPEPTLTGKPSDERFVKNVIRYSAIKTSSISAALSIPGGAAGLLSVIPDVISVWRLQAGMISNIAAIYGKNAMVTREQMLWCMFRQIAIGLTKELIIQQAGEYIVRQQGEKIMNRLIEKIGHGALRSQGAKFLSKAVPVLGSVSAGALTYYDTCRVGKNAVELYSGNIILLPENTAKDRTLKDAGSGQA